MHNTISFINPMKLKKKKTKIANGEKRSMSIMKNYV